MSLGIYILTLLELKKKKEEHTKDLRLEALLLSSFWCRLDLSIKDLWILMEGIVLWEGRGG